MKKLFFLLLLISGSAIAQTNDYPMHGSTFRYSADEDKTSRQVHLKGTHEVTFGAGWLSGRDLAIQAGINTATNITSASPTYYFSYRYFLSRRFAVGFTAGTQTLSGIVKQDSQFRDTYNFTDKCTTVAFEMTSVYMQRKIATWYTRMGVGFSFIKEQQDYVYSSATSQNFTLFNFQYTPFGVRVGKTLAGFLELGIGYKGVVHGGLSFAIKNKHQATGHSRNEPSPTKSHRPTQAN